MSALSRLALALLLVAGGDADEPTGLPWRPNPAWDARTVERCTYQAARGLLGERVEYTATAETRAVAFDPATTVVAEEGAPDAVPALQQVWSEHFGEGTARRDLSTSTLTRHADLAPLRLTVAAQGPHGASFKELLRAGPRLSWRESVFHAGGGLRRGSLDEDVVLEDALPLVLRSYPFDDPELLELRVVPSQATTRSVSFEPARRWVRFQGVERVMLPGGPERALRLDLADGPEAPALGTYWFAEEAGAPWHRALLRYQGTGGRSLRLERLEAPEGE